jgi:hypothetical protein
MNDRIDTDRGRIAKPCPFNPRSPKCFGKILSNAANVKCKKIYPIGPPSVTRSHIDVLNDLN